MYAKEKAEEIFNKYFSEIRMPYDCEGCMQCIGRCENMVEVAKKYSIIAVNEILNAYPHRYEIEKEKTINNEDITIIKNVKSNVGYWLVVKREIEKL